MFKVNNKDTRTTLMASFYYINFEHVIAGSVTYIGIRFGSPLSKKFDIASLICSTGDDFLEKGSRYLRTNLLLLSAKVTAANVL